MPKAQIHLQPPPVCQEQLDRFGGYAEHKTQSLLHGAHNIKTKYIHWITRCKRHKFQAPLQNAALEIRSSYPLDSLDGSGEYYAMWN